MIRLMAKVRTEHKVRKVIRIARKQSRDIRMNCLTDYLLRMGPVGSNC